MEDFDRRGDYNNKMKESEIQTDIMKLLLTHPKVAWAYVTSAGMVKGIGGGRPFRVGFVGLADILGQMNDGRLLAIEVKRPGKKPTEEQVEFLDAVSDANGVAGWVDSIEGAVELLK